MCLDFCIFLSLCTSEVYTVHLNRTSDTAWITLFTFSYSCSYSCYKQRALYP